MTIELERLAAELRAKILANRERYLAAWLAETGLLPSECEIVERRRPDADGLLTVVVTVRRRT